MREIWKHVESRGTKKIEAKGLPAVLALHTII